MQNLPHVLEQLKLCRYIKLRLFISKMSRQAMTGGIVAWILGSTEGVHMHDFRKVDVTRGVDEGLIQNNSWNMACSFA